MEHPATTDRVHIGRSLSYAAFAGIVLVYLVIIQLGGRLTGHLGDEDQILTTRGLVVTMVLPLGLAFLFTYAVIAYLGWWRPVLREETPVQRWVWVVPVVFAVAIAAGIDYNALSEKDFAYLLVLLIATQLVGWGEEGMFRGIGVTVFRQHGLREGRVALWSSIVFGAVHLTNAFGSGASAIPQAIAVSLAGYFFYLIRRISGGNALNSVVHGLFDFAIISSTTVLADQDFYIGVLAPIALYPLLAIIVLIKRKSIEPALSATPQH